MQFKAVQSDIGNRSILNHEFTFIRKRTQSKEEVFRKHRHAEKNKEQHPRARSPTLVISLTLTSSPTFTYPLSTFSFSLFFLRPCKIHPHKTTTKHKKNYAYLYKHLRLLPAPRADELACPRPCSGHTPTPPRLCASPKHCHQHRAAACCLPPGRHRPHARPFDPVHSAARRFIVVCGWSCAACPAPWAWC